MRMKDLGLLVGGTVLIAGLGYGGYQAYKKLFSPETPNDQADTSTSVLVDAPALIVEWKPWVAKIIQAYVDSGMSTNVHAELAKLGEMIPVEDREDMAAHALAIMLRNWGRPVEDIVVDDGETVRLQMSNEAAQLGELYDRLRDIEAQLSDESLPKEKYPELDDQAATIRTQIADMLTPKLGGNVVELGSKGKKVANGD